MGMLLSIVLMPLLCADAKYYTLPYHTATITGKKHRIVWTFDDHPNKTTPKVLALLKRAKLQATFFVNAYTIANSKKYPYDWKLKRVVGYYKKIKSAGHVLANHGHTHRNLCKLSRGRIRWELTSTQNLVKKLIGVTMKYWRPPHGTVCKKANKEAHRLKLKRVMWDIGDYRVSAKTMWRQLIRRVRRRKKATVILFHSDTKKLKTIIGRMKKGR